MEAAGGVDLPPEAGHAAAIVLDFSVGESSSSTPVKVPRRIRRRLLECRSSPPSSVEEIEAKLKEADLRRQQFHEWLSSKARPKARSPSWSSQEEDLGQRLEAKLNAAEQKRLSLLANAQMRLARLDELRQAAKNGAEIRSEKQREELGSRVESRVQKAEANRMHLLKAHMQRHAAVEERKARSLFQRIVRENKYKEHIRCAISQKRSAAERKRMVLLEAEKSRAQSRVMQARRVAKAICCQREGERRLLKERLEHRLQRAKRQRAEFLRLRGNTHNSSRVNLIKNGDLLSRKLAWCWRQFVRSRKTTLTLAQAYETLGINENSVRSMPFDRLARVIESATTIQTVKDFLDRLESRFLLHQSSNSCSPENIDHLLSRLASPRKRTPPSKKSRAVAKKGSSTISCSGSGKLSRYPVRAVLCAYMILGHPNAVFSEQGEREVALAKAASHFAREFELLMKVILDGASIVHITKQPTPDVMFDESKDHEDCAVQSPPAKSFRSQLLIFDDVWRSYLYCFVVWKVKDARLLEDDLVRAACQLELSMMQTCKLTSKGEMPKLSHDMRAIQEQVIEDQKLLREKVEHLSGKEGLQRMEFALSDIRARFFEAKESGTPLVSYVTPLSSPTLVSSAVKKPVDPLPKEDSLENIPSSNHVIRSLFGGTSLGPKPGTIFQLPSSQSSSKVDRQPPSENELLVNEIVHSRSSFTNDFEMTYGSNIKAKVKETMEKAFWDVILESVKEDSPDYGRILGLVQEVRDELSEIAPLSWKQDIHDSIDLDILSQVMELETQDKDYLGSVLEYALLTLRKLSAPSNEGDLKKSHEKLLNDLASVAQSDGKKKSSFTFAMINGLRFVLEQIQSLKKEISKTRIQMIEPIIKGSAGFEYLQKAFEDRYGPPSSAIDSLSVTTLWISPLKNIADEEWNDYVDSLSVLSESHAHAPVMSLRTGGNMPQKHRQSPHSAETRGDEQPGCTGEKLDVLLRLGLLKFASSVEGLIADTLPETLQLNVLRLRLLQSQLQQIIVISTSILVLRQVVISEHLALSSTDLDIVVSNSVKSLSKLVDDEPDINIEEIIEALAGSFPEDERLKARKQVLSRLLTKSLGKEDPVFTKMYHSVYLATRAVLFGGSGPSGQRLAQGILQKVGAAMLLDRVVRAAEVLIIMARVSIQVHGPWYGSLV